jgi:hypothetical protein
LAIAQKAIAHLESLGKPADVMVNHVLEIDETGSVTLQPLPEGHDA